MFSKNWASILFTTLVLSVAALMQLPGSLKAQSLPDLSVTAFTIEKDAVCVAKFTVVNSGPEVLQEIHIYGDQVFDQYLKIVLPEGEFKSEVNFQKGCPKNSAEIVVDATNMVVESDESDESNKKWICIPCIVTPTPTSTPTATFVPTATSVVTNTQILVLEPQSSITETFVVLVSPGGEYKWHAWVNGEFCWGVNVFNGGFKLLTCDLGIQSIESIEFHVLKNLQEDVVLATATWPLPTATPTNTPVPPTSTATNTPVPSTSTATATNTPVPPTATNTPISSNPKMDIQVSGSQITFTIIGNHNLWMPSTFGWLNSTGGSFTQDLHFVNGVFVFDKANNVIRIWVMDAVPNNLELSSNWDVDINTKDAVMIPTPNSIYLPIVQK